MKTSDKDGRTLAVAVMSAWQEYQANGYPKDPNCYVVRASPEAVAQMRHLVIVNTPPEGFVSVVEPENRFLWFRLEEDPRLSSDEVYFGPETIRIEWSKK